MEEDDQISHRDTGGHVRDNNFSDSQNPGSTVDKIRTAPILKRGFVFILKIIN